MRLVNIFWQHELGSGGEGAVYLGQFTDGEWCAIKAPGPSLLQLLHIPAFRAYVQQQMSKEYYRHRQVRGNRHVRLLGVCLDAPVPFIALELATNGTLRREMRTVFARGYVYPPLRALRRTIDMLAALEDAHASGILHRDVKPDNFLLFGDTVKLADFGVGRTLLRPTRMQTQAFVGTPLYAAPEQLLMGRLDARTDIYSVGVILYEMLMGDVPPLEARMFRRPSHRFSNVTNKLEHFLARLLAVNPEQRPASAHLARQEAEFVMLEYLALALRQVQMGSSTKAMISPALQTI
jgi:serine/threonine protein kinase